jgi:hypothetical protein
MKESFLRGVAAMVLAAALAGCGGADDHEDPAATASVENPLDSDTLPEGSLSIQHVDHPPGRRSRSLAGGSDRPDRLTER